MTGFIECTKCHVWGDIPKEFRENKHFGKCPKCSQPMFLVRFTAPKEVGLQLKNKVTCGLMLHKDI